MQSPSTGSSAFDAPRAPVSGDPAMATPLLIATDGTQQSVPAIYAGAAIARHLQLVPRILTVITPSVIPPTSVTSAVLTRAQPSDADRIARARWIRAQLRACVDEGGGWPVEVEVGNPSETIGRTAMRDGIGLVMMGLRPHGRWDRVAGRETVLRVVRQVSAPVLAVTPRLQTLPRHVLVAMDFSRSSIRALRVALQLVDRGATIDIAYVRPAQEFDSDVAEGTGVIIRQGVAASFARLHRILRVPRGVALRPMLLDGKPGDALLHAAAEHGADLIAVGRHRRDFLDRFTISSVATQLIRAAQCSVLVTPARPQHRG